MSSADILLALDVIVDNLEEKPALLCDGLDDVLESCFVEAYFHA